jgi:hypothetical protein
MFVFRKRQFRESIFLEFYLAFNGLCLDLPPKLPARFESRILKTFSIDISSLSGQSNVQCFLVDSKAPGVMKQTLQDIKTNGVWAVYQDTISRGAYCSEECTVKGIPSFFGLTIATSIYFKLYNGIIDAYKCLDLDISHDPYIVYHGTCRSSVSEILKAGFKSSFGMLGQAIYFGTFWKAFRFATRTQEYIVRPGAILRVYAFWSKVYIRSLDSDYCLCKKCCSGPETDARRLADHDSIWSAFGDAVHVVAGGPLKNEEYA